MENNRENFRKLIEKKRSKLIQKAQKTGMYENFGDRETTELNDYLQGSNMDYSDFAYCQNLVSWFFHWAINYEGK